MSDVKKYKGKHKEYTVLFGRLDWEEKETDREWFKNLLASGDYEDNCPLIRIPNMDQWNNDDPHAELEVELTRNPINLFGKYLIDKYGVEKGLYFLRLFCVELGIFSPDGKIVDNN